MVNDKDKTIVVLESPNKIKKISAIIGSNYIVVASCGHIRDLKKQSLSINVDDNFKPDYVVDKDKKDIIQNLKQKYSKYKNVLLACDNDREGEAIAFHISEILKIPKDKRKRMIFTEITKSAILKSIKSPKDIDMNMFYAQQARRIIDRLIGYKISPILWKNIQNTMKKGQSLSAGRVQSVVNKLIIEREEDIKKFKSVNYYKTSGFFQLNKNKLMADLDFKIDTKNKAEEFLEESANSIFRIDEIKKFVSTRKPSPPFITSTLQQEVSNKFKIGPKQTMIIAQKLYVDGLITYMRTDSTILSEEILDGIKSYITNKYGDKYYNRHQYTSKSKNSQEAHEAIRPCKLEIDDLGKLDKYSNYEIRVYNLIWKRTVASQMSHCKVDNFNIKIGIYEDLQKSKYTFISKIENIIFDGFTKLYTVFVPEENESENENKTHSIKNMDELKKNSILDVKYITSQEKYSKPKYLRFTEASLIKKLDNLGIGRPSTYSSMISIIQDRKYANKQDIEGTKIKLCELKLINDTIEESNSDSTINGEKQKLIPTDIGFIVNQFLVKHFENILNNGFTEQIESNLDKISNGELDWVKMVHDVYKTFNPIVISLNKTESSLLEKTKYSRVLGRDPTTNYEICTYIAKFGPVVQLKNTDNPKKSKFSPLKDIKMEKVTLKEALELLKYPFILGKFKNKEIKVCKGQYGIYLKYDEGNYSIYNISEENLNLSIASDIIKNKNSNSNSNPSTGGEKYPSNIINTYKDNDGKDIVIKNGKFGHYINYQNKNYKIYLKKKKEEITKEDCLNIIKNYKFKS